MALDTENTLRQRKGQTEAKQAEKATEQAGGKAADSNAAHEEEEGGRSMLHFLFDPIDNSSLVYFRIFWGLVMAYECYTFMKGDYRKLEKYYMRSDFYPKYHLFEWVHAWPGNGMYIHIWAMVDSSLLVKPRDPWKEAWDGKLFGAEGATAFVDQEEGSAMRVTTATNVSFPDMFTEWSRDLDVAYVCSETQKSKQKTVAKAALPLKDARVVMEPMRLIKSVAEQRLAHEVADVTAEAFIEVMKASVPGMNEGLIDAQLEWEYRKRGAERHAFPPVVAGGERALVLHYVTNDKPIGDGDLVLVDSGAEKSCFNSDVSRTWPINGKYSPAQKELYEAVLGVQKACIKHCVVGEDFNNVHRMSERLTTEALKKLGILPGWESIMTKGGNKFSTSTFYPHSIGHWLGMDVHDTPGISTGRPLQAGMIVTVEPGLYIPADAAIPEKYHGVGIRIEDDVLITEDGPVVLTKNIPKEVDEVEALLAR